MSLSFVSISLISVLSIVNAAVLIPNTCSKNSEDYSSCLKGALQGAWPIIVRGIPELGIPVLDPYATEYASCTFEFGDITGKLVVKNALSYGASNIEFNSIKLYHSKDYFRLVMDFLIPRAFVDSDYKAEGNLGTFTHHAKGKFNVSMENIRTIVQMEGSVVNDTWVIEEFSLTPVVGDMRVWASNLFKGNELLNSAALTFINQNWQLIWQAMMPTASKFWNETLKNTANEIFSKVSFSSCFP